MTAGGGKDPPPRLGAPMEDGGHRKDRKNLSGKHRKIVETFNLTGGARRSGEGCILGKMKTFFFQLFVQS